MFSLANHFKEVSMAAKSFNVASYSASDPCLCGELETIEVTGGSWHARLCAACMMFFIARAEGNGRSTPPARAPKGRGKAARPSESPDSAGAGDPPAVPTADLWTDREPAKAS